jgi:hypothetical protein
MLRVSRHKIRFMVVLLLGCVKSSVAGDCERVREPSKGHAHGGSFDNARDERGLRERSTRLRGPDFAARWMKCEASFAATGGLVLRTETELLELELKSAA